MLRNLGLVRGISTGGRKHLSTRQQQAKKECLYDVEAYPAEKGYVRSSPYGNINIPNLTIHQYVWKNFREWETKIATVSDKVQSKDTKEETNFDQWLMTQYKRW